MLSLCSIWKQCCCAMATTAHTCTKVFNDQSVSPYMQCTHSGVWRLPHTHKSSMEHATLAHNFFEYLPESLRLQFSLCIKCHTAHAVRFWAANLVYECMQLWYGRCQPPVFTSMNSCIHGYLTKGHHNAASTELNKVNSGSAVMAGQAVPNRNMPFKPPGQLTPNRALAMKYTPLHAS